ncbi:MAG: tail fiber domain-containing protein [Acidobacteriia bacterium]|nr:tail fiber domain-containing protein [Terriglobia bacterium]
MRLTIAPLVGTFCLFSLAPLFAQQPDQTTASVPRLVRITNTFHPANGLPVGATESATLSIYKKEQGGTPLWQETQNVTLDAEGHYTAMLGATQNDGVPVDLFSATEPRWLGVQFNRPGEVEQPRVQLVSVPYALRASDAETLGGKPASAYVLAPSASGTSGGTAVTAESANVTVTSANPKALKPKADSGTTNCIGVFTDATDVGCSVMWQSGSNIGVNITSPLDTLHVQGSFRIGNGVFGANGFSFTQDNSGNLQAQYKYPTQVYSNIMTWGYNGNVGVGAVAPLDTLHVQGGLRIGNGVFGSNGFTFTQNSTGNLQIQYKYPSLVYSNVMTLGYNGTVGVATVTPFDTLHVQGGFRIGNGIFGSNGFSFTQDGAGNLQVQYKYPSLVYSNIMTFGYGGAVGFGNTAPAWPVDVAGDINFTGALRFQSTPLLQLPGGLTTNNFAAGASALTGNSTGTSNTAVGNLALTNNSSGVANTGIGPGALQLNVSGNYNTGVGQAALQFSTGSANTGVGSLSLNQEVSGSNNTAIGAGSLEALQTGTGNTGIGFNAGGYLTSGSNNIYIGNLGTAGENGTLRIGTAGTQTSLYLAGVTASSLPNGAPLVWDTTTNQVGYTSSSRRYKEDIADMGEVTSGLMQLRPVTFRYRQPSTDGSKPVQYGLIAEEVEEIYPDLVAHSADGQVETVKYQVLDSMLLNEVQRQHREIGAQRDQIRGLEQQNQMLQDRLARLEAAIAAAAGAQGK